MAKTVKYYDPDTEKIIEIPSAELAIGCVGGKVDGIGEVWMDDYGRADPQIRHPRLSKKLLKDVRRVAAAMSDLHPQTIEQWEDGFRRQADPAGEIALWLHMAEVMQAWDKDKQSSPGQRREALLFLLKYSMCPEGSAETVLDILPPLAIGKVEALEAMCLYDGADPQRWHKSNIGRAE